MANIKMTPEQEKQYVRDSLLFFYESKTNYDKHKQSFDNVKQEFESDMELYFDKYSDENGEIRIKTSDMYAGTIGVKVKKIEPTSVEINAQKFVHECHDADIRKDVVNSGYCVTDTMGLLKFLKSKGIKYVDVKPFIKRTLTVNIDKVNQYVELGEIDEELVKACADVKFRKPYYKFTPIQRKNPIRPAEVK